MILSFIIGIIIGSVIGFVNACILISIKQNKYNHEGGEK